MGGIIRASEGKPNAASLHDLALHGKAQAVWQKGKDQRYGQDFFQCKVLYIIERDLSARMIIPKVAMVIAKVNPPLPFRFPLLMPLTEALSPFLTPPQQPQHRFLSLSPLFHMPLPQLAFGMLALPPTASTCCAETPSTPISFPLFFSVTLCTCMQSATKRSRLSLDSSTERRK